MRYQLDHVSKGNDGPVTVAHGITRQAATKEASAKAAEGIVFFITPEGKLYPTHRWDRKRQRWVRTSL